MRTIFTQDKSQIIPIRKFTNIVVMPSINSDFFIHIYFGEKERHFLGCYDDVTTTKKVMDELAAWLSSTDTQYFQMPQDD